MDLPRFSPEENRGKVQSFFQFLCLMQQCGTVGGLTLRPVAVEMLEVLSAYRTPLPPTYSSPDSSSSSRVL